MVGRVGDGSASCHRKRNVVSDTFDKLGEKYVHF